MRVVRQPSPALWAEMQEQPVFGERNKAVVGTEGSEARLRGERGDSLAATASVFPSPGGPWLEPTLGLHETPL